MRLLVSLCQLNFETKNILLFPRWQLQLEQINEIGKLNGLFVYLFDPFYSNRLAEFESDLLSRKIPFSTRQNVKNSACTSLPSFNINSSRSMNNNLLNVSMEDVSMEDDSMDDVSVVDLPILASSDSSIENSDLEENSNLNYEKICSDDIISNLLIDHQATTGSSDATMEKMLKLINKIARLKGIETDIVPDTFYGLTKNIAISSPGIRFVCKNEKCRKLTKVIHRQTSKGYGRIECESCLQIIDPIEEISGKSGYFVILNPVQRIQRMLENSLIRHQIEFCDETKLRSIKTFGKFNSGRIYRNSMKEGDLSLTFFADGVKVFSSSSNDFWPALLSINELHPSLRNKFVFPAAIYFGPNKPQAELLMECVQDDLNFLATNGVDWSSGNVIINTKVNIDIYSSFYIKCIKCMIYRSRHFLVFSIHKPNQHFLVFLTLVASPHVQDVILQPKKLVRILSSSILLKIFCGTLDITHFF